MKKIAFKDGKFHSMYESDPEVRILPVDTDDVFNITEEIEKEVLKDSSKVTLSPEKEILVNGKKLKKSPK